MRKPIDKHIFCNSGNNGAKYHVSRDVHGPAFGPRCKARGANRGSVFAYPSNTTVEDTRVCSKCLQYTVEVAE